MQTTVNKHTYVTDIAVLFFQMTTEAFAGLGFPGAEQLGAMFEFYQKGNPVRDVELTRKLNENMPNFDQWVNNNKDALDEATN